MGFTNFPNGVTSFGIPAVGASVPTTFGEYIWVDPDATGANSGKNRRDAFLTVGQAVDKAVTDTNTLSF
jgi:hypothetical protein